MQISRLRLISCLTIGVVSTSSASILIRYAQAENAPTLSIAAWRFIFTSLILQPYVWTVYRSEIAAISRKEWGLLVASGVFLGLHFATWTASLGYTSVASSVVLVSMGPLFVGLGSWVLLKERPTKKLAIGIGLAAAGSAAIGWSDYGVGTARLLGGLLALTGAMMVAGYLMIGRKVRPRRSLWVYIALVYGAATLTLLVIVGVGQQPMLGFSRRAYGWMLALGLIPQMIGHTTLNWALRHLSATYVSLITLAEPLCAGVLAYLIFAEAVSWPLLAGGGLILGGIFIASRNQA